MQFSTLFSRAWQQKYLLPGERAVYKFTVALIVLIPSSALLGGVGWVLNSLHASAPSWLWSILAVLLPALLFMLAKYVTAQGDTQVGAIIQQVETGAVVDIAIMPSKQPAPIVLPPASPVPPRASAPPTLPPSA